MFIDIMNLVSRSPGGGIGRHAGLKILFAEKASAGSIPAPGTNKSLKQFRDLFLSGLEQLKINFQEFTDTRYPLVFYECCMCRMIIVILIILFCNKLH